MAVNRPHEPPGVTVLAGEVGQSGDRDAHHTDAAGVRGPGRSVAITDQMPQRSVPQEGFGYWPIYSALGVGDADPDQTAPSMTKITRLQSSLNEIVVKRPAPVGWTAPGARHNATIAVSSTPEFARMHLQNAHR